MSPADKLILRGKLGLTPDQHEQFDTLPDDILANLAALKPALQALIGEQWRVKQAVGDTNFSSDPEDRFKAWRDEEEHEARWQAALNS